MSDPRHAGHTAPPGALGIRLIAERVVVRIQGQSGWRAAELSLDQARMAREHLDEAILAIETGGSIAPNLASLIASLPEEQAGA